MQTDWKLLVELHVPVVLVLYMWQTSQLQAMKAALAFHCWAPETNKTKESWSGAKLTKQDEVLVNMLEASLRHLMNALAQ
jgi:hypothetical protein